ncbi:MAG: glycosyltransferase [Chlamydiota bacterium]|nr:glycosyltransferase [Chlamydiota bacterium]
MTNVTVIIPTLNAQRYLEKLFQAIKRQSYSSKIEILIIDSSSKDRTVEFAENNGARCIKISKNDFSHGYARNLGIQNATGELVVFLSQDALPFDDSWLKNLITPLIHENVAASFSRQIPYDSATPMERYFIKTHFPLERKIMHPPTESRDLRLLDVFFSNVSSAAKRDIALRTPFWENLIMSEDQQFSRDLLSKGYTVSYEPSSCVWHSHRYGFKTVFQRYFDSAYSLNHIFDQKLPESVRIIRNYYKGEFKEILTRHFLWLPYYFLYLLAKTGGAVAGHYAEKLPRSLAKRLSMHKDFWDRKELVGSDKSG